MDMDFSPPYLLLYVGSISTADRTVVHMSKK